MAPTPGVDVNGIAAGGEEGLACSGSDSKLVKNEKAGAVKTPVQAYENGTQVPSKFIQDPKMRPTRGWGDDAAASQLMRQNMANLPVIDMSPLMIAGADEESTKKVTAEIGRACEEWGFFQAVNHQIPESLLDHLLEVAKEFFMLPLEEKQVYAVQPGENEGYGVSFEGPISMWNDSLRHTIRPKPAPEKDRLPAKPPAYRGLLKEYTEGVERILQVVWTALSDYLDLDSTTLQKAQEDDSRLVIRLNYYPKCPEPEKVMGLSGHKDFGSLTVLLQDQVGGLQIQKPGTNDESDVWLDVRPKKGSVLINVANQVEILSNGRYKSVMHRALVNRNTARLSIAAFATPGPKCTISPLEELLEKSRQVPRYKHVLYGNYISNFVADTTAGIPAHARYEINRD